MIFGRSKILLTKFKLINSVKCVCLNQIWLGCNALQVKACPVSSGSNTSREIKVCPERLETDDENKKLITEENLQLSETDILSQETVEALLKMVHNRNKDTLSPSKIMIILNQLHNLHSQNKSKLSKRNIRNVPAFFKLFLILEDQIYEMGVDDLLNLYSFIKKFKLPDTIMDNSKVTVEILRRMNELDFCQKVRLYNLYSTSEDLNINEKSRLEFLIISEAKRKLKSSLIEDKLDVLSHSLMFPMSIETKNEILNTVLDLGRENWCQYNVAYSFLNFFNYVHKDFSEFDDIQGRLLDILQECANDYKFISTVPDFFPTLADMVVFKKIEFRSYLFDCILDNVVKYKLSFQDKMIILDAMYGMRFFHLGLIENLVELAIKDPSILNEQYLFTITKTVAYSNNYFKKKEWERLFTSRKDLINWDSEKKLFQYAKICATVGLFDDEVFQQLSKKFTKELFLTKRSDSCLLILQMNHAIAAWNPTYPGIFLPEEIRLLAIREAQKRLDHFYIFWSAIVKELLESAVGIKDCVLTCCWSKHGEIIDQVMALNENGDPISLANVKKNSQEIIYIEDIPLPPGCKLFFILNFHRGERIINIHSLMREHILKFNLIKELGHPVIYAFFDYDLARKLSDSEKGHYLWKQIREKYIAMKRNKTAANEPILIPLNTRSISLLEPGNKKIDIVISSEKSWLDNILPAIDGHVWYTDGSKKISGLGSGIYYPEKELEISNYLDFDGSSFEAEVDAIAACAQKAYYASIENRNVYNLKTVVNILTDSYSAITHISDLKPITSERVLNCKKILKKLSENVKVRIIWVPGHFGIKGNQIADSLAKKGASGIQMFSEKITDGER